MHVLYGNWIEFRINLIETGKKNTFYSIKLIYKTGWNITVILFFKWEYCTRVPTARSQCDFGNHK